MREKGLVCGVVYDYINNSRRLVSKNDELPSICGDYAKTYFNSGMLLVDLDSWRKLGIEQESLMIAKNYNLKEHDQSILNASLLHKTLKLPLRYNLLVYMYINANTLEHKKPNIAYTKEELSESLANPCILHFYTHHKPWVDYKVYVDLKDNFLGHYWWDMACKTSIFCSELEKLRQVADKNKVFQVSLGFMLYKLTRISFVFSPIIVPIVTCIYIMLNKTINKQIPNNLYNISYEIGKAGIYAHNKRKKRKYFSLPFKILNMVKKY